MVDKLELILEAERRGILPESKKALLEEARKRGIVPPADNKQIRSSGPKVPTYVGDEQGEFNINDPAQAERAERFTQQSRLEQVAQEKEEKRLANRGIGQRAVDTASFIASMPIRMATKGEYGIGDAVGLISKTGGQNFRFSEQDFARANAPFLEGAAQAGEVLSGVPGLNTMGVPLKGLGATMGAMRYSPRGAVAGAIRGVGEAMESSKIATPMGDIVISARQPGAIAGQSTGQLPTFVGRAGRGLQGYADNMKPPVPKQSTTSAAAAGLPENIQTIPERLRDYVAFRALGMRPFGPSLGSQASARVGRTIEEVPIIGGIVKSPKQTAELEAKAAQESIARELGAPPTEEAAGALVQRALGRYRTAGLEELEPGTLRKNPNLQTSVPTAKGPGKPQGIDPYQPLKAADIMSEPAAQRMRDPDIAAARVAGGGGMATTSRGVEVPNAQPLNQMGLRRTGVEDLSDAQVARVARASSRDTSFQTRAEALYESAERKIPELKRTDGTANPNQIPTVNLGNAIRSTMGEVANQIAGQSTIRGRLADLLTNGRANTQYNQLRSIRTEIGRALSNFGQFETGLDRSQLKRLYAAATQDMEIGLRDLANRAWRDHRAGPLLENGKKNLAYIDAATARKADAALYEFRRADRYFRQGMERMDKFMGVLDAKTPNEAARKIITALKEKTANPGMLREIGNVLRPEELKAFQGHIIAQLGSKRPGAIDAETIFNWNNWATDFNAIATSPGGRAFLEKGMGKETLAKLDNLARVVNRMKYYEATKNYSGSAYTALGIIGLTSVKGALVGAAMGAGWGKLLTSNAFLAWNEALMKAQLKAGNTAASNMRIAAQYARRLPALAKGQRGDPDLQQALTALGVSIDQQLDQKQKVRALPAPSP